jgi:hypothetical protein
MNFVREYEESTSAHACGYKRGRGADKPFPVVPCSGRQCGELDGPGFYCVRMSFMDAISKTMASTRLMTV